jgi:indole-3-glycerol phosphate synthase
VNPRERSARGVLAEILASKEREIEALCGSLADPTDRAVLGVASRLVRGAGQPLRLIAEIKRRSPSAGALSTVLSPGERAVAYARAGAAMVSVLCDGPFFDGGWHHLTEVRQALDRARSRTPVLAKEFVLDEVQIAEARQRGADAVLLIARIVSPTRLSELVQATRDTGLEPLVEVVDEEEVATALEAGALVIGVNARDLDTLVVDAGRAERVIAAIPRDRIAVHLSGVRTEDDVRKIAASSAHAALLGEALMRVDDPTDVLRALCAATGEPPRM